MRRIIIHTVFTIFCLVLVSCEKEETFEQNPFVISFDRQSVDFSSIEKDYNVKLVFSEPATASGSVIISKSETNASFGNDYITSPKFQESSLTLEFTEGQTELNFTFTNLIYPFDRDDKQIQFKIERIDYPGRTSIQGYSVSTISFDRSLGATIAPNIGGPNEPNAVFIDLATERETVIRRDTWDLSFYSGDLFRVAINGSLYMAAKSMETTDMNSVNTSTALPFFTEVMVGTFDNNNLEFIDYPDGDIEKTAIREISSNDDENPVYLLNMGYEIGTMEPTTGSVLIAGDSRGWKKIRILRNGENGYLLQYANLDDTTFQTIEIPKTSSHNFTHFSITTNSIVSVEPAKDAWDLCFNVFTNLNEGAGSYGFSDFVNTNNKAGVQAYRVDTSNSISYANFSADQIDESKFTNDQREIGASWRSVTDRILYNDRFYVLKDVKGNYYKIRMLAFMSETGVRGYPKFEYQLIK